VRPYGDKQKDVATYHCSVKVGGAGKGAAHDEYLRREGRYKDGDRYEDLEYAGYGNMPKWAEHNPAHFWKAADKNERKNGSVYREFEIALPRELTPDQRRDLVQDIIKHEIGDKHAYTVAIHCPKASLEGGEQPHAHIMYSERKIDRFERDPEQYFKRANKSKPEMGGCVKSDKFSGGKTADQRQEAIKKLRANIADATNKHLERHGHTSRVDHRSLKEQGIDREPERHLGGSGVRQHGVYVKKIRDEVLKEVSTIEAPRGLERDGPAIQSGRFVGRKTEVEQRLQAGQEAARKAAEKNAVEELWLKFIGIDTLPLPEQARLYDYGLKVLSKEVERQQADLMQGAQSDYAQASHVLDAAKKALTSLKPGLFDIFHKQYDAAYDRLKAVENDAYDNALAIWERLKSAKALSALSPGDEALRLMRRHQPELHYRVEIYRERLNNPLPPKPDAQQLRKLQENRGDLALERQRPPPQMLNNGKRRGR
jgi:hypothetical protein